MWQWEIIAIYIEHTLRQGDLHAQVVLPFPAQFLSEFTLDLFPHEFVNFWHEVISSSLTLWIWGNRNALVSKLHMPMCCICCSNKGHGVRLNSIWGWKHRGINSGCIGKRKPVHYDCAGMTPWSYHDAHGCCVRHRSQQWFSSAILCWCSRIMYYHSGDGGVQCVCALSV